KAHGVAGVDRKLTEGLEVSAVERGRCPQDQSLWPGNSVDRVVLEAIDPRHACAVIEAQHELSLENYSTRPTGDNAHQMGTVRGRHKVDYRRSAGSCLKFGFENESIGTIIPAHHELRGFWCDEPPSIIDRPKESGEACGRIEARPAQPIDRAVAANQSRSPAIANKCIVFDAKRHCPSLL